VGKDRSTPLYKVWWPEGGQDDDDGIDYGALDVRSAARLWSAAAHRDDPATQFPITLRVRDPKGRQWDVEVERIAIPEFEAGKPVAV
jgi:hypothetical protein